MNDPDWSSSKVSGIEKVADSDICTAQIYDCAPMMSIYRWDKITGSELELKILDRSFLEVVDTERILKKLILSHGSNWKAIDLVT